MGVTCYRKSQFPNHIAISFQLQTIMVIQNFKFVISRKWNTDEELDGCLYLLTKGCQSCCEEYNAEDLCGIEAPIGHCRLKLISVGTAQEVGCSNSQEHKCLQIIYVMCSQLSQFKNLVLSQAGLHDTRNICFEPVVSDYCNQQLYVVELISPYSQ